MLCWKQVTCFPLLGVDDFIQDPLPFDAPHSQSEYLPDYIINPHPRFAALTRNIRERRGAKVDIRVPLYKDENTPEYSGKKEFDADPYIHMDCMAFGMGMCCLVSYRLTNIVSCRELLHSRVVLQ